MSDIDPFEGTAPYKPKRRHASTRQPAEEVVAAAGSAHTTEDHRPTIRIQAGRLPQIASEGENALISARVPFYRRDNQIVRPIVDEVDAADGGSTQIAQLLPVTDHYLRDALGRHSMWVRFDRRRNEWVGADPPKDVSATILARQGEWRFPSVAGIVTAPTLRPDGTVLDAVGYDGKTRFILTSPPKMQKLPSAPTREDAESALATLYPLLDEFPLKDDASMSVAFSMLITPVVRGAFPTAPLHVVRSPVPASGKSFLVDLAAAIAIGERCPVMAAGRTDEESEKRLGAALLAGQSLVSIDNVSDQLGGDFLCQAVERPRLLVRILGQSTQARVETSTTTFFATGVNLTITGDLTRRSIVASLDPQLERPELRDFRDNPVKAVMADRGRYIAAALIIVRAYIVAGRPDLAQPLASYEGWSGTVRSSLMWLGLADPVETMDLARAEDPELSTLSEILTAWVDAFGLGRANEHTAAAVLQSAEEIRYGDDGKDYRRPELREAIAPAALRNGAMNGRAFGRWLARAKGRIVNGQRLSGTGDAHGHAKTWWVERV